VDGDSKRHRQVKAELFLVFSGAAVSPLVRDQAQGPDAVRGGFEIDEANNGGTDKKSSPLSAGPDAHWHLVER
jgi:hypothetical protein